MIAGQRIAVVPLSAVICLSTTIPVKIEWYCDGPGERADSGERDQEIDCAYNSAGPGVLLQ